MKKLMIAAAIVCAAVASQAASFSWTTATAKGPAAANLFTPGWYVSGTATADSLMMENKNYGIVWSAVMDITSDLGTDKLENLTPSFGAKSTSLNGLSSAKIANGTDAEPLEATVTVILTGTYEKDGVTYTITSDAIEASGSFGELTTLAFDAPATTGWTITKSGGPTPTPTPTPEPTSGLLLILGVAGLALRRKQK